jgi:DNA-directed RNA polymerase subunit RPC12/RpoP
MRHWKIIDRGRVPTDRPRIIEYSCPGCGKEALLPVAGLPLAQLGGGGVVFDDGDGCLPPEVACPHCRRQFTTKPEPEEDGDVRQAI